jgi:hypothetical protein
MPLHDDDDDHDRRPSRRRYDDEDEDEDRPRRRRRWGDDEDDYDFRKRVLPHSGLGIVSCIFAGLTLFAGLVAIVIAASSGLDEDFEAAVDAGEPAAVVFTLLFAGAGLLCLIGGVLALAGLTQQNRNKTFAVVGLCANAVFFLCGGGLMLIGAAA